MPRRGETSYTADQAAEVVQHYLGGSTAAGAAAGMPFGEATARKIIQAAGVMRSKSTAQHLLADQEDPVTPDMAQRARALYDAGWGAKRIARKLGLPESQWGWVRRTLGPLRSQSEAAFARHGLEIREVSADRWRELYWGDDLPSCDSIAARLGVSANTIRRYLRRHDIRIRTPGEQERIDIRKGRRAIPVNPRSYANLPPPAERPACQQGRKKRRASVARMVTSKTLPRLPVPCAWCGTPRLYAPHELNEKPRPSCGFRCSVAAREWTKKHPGGPRPVIVRKLRELIGPEPATWERAERLAAPLGATEDEIAAALTGA